MTDICSVWAYDEIKGSGYVGTRQAQYLYIFIRENRPLSHIQATKLVQTEFKIKLPERNGRLSELEEFGFIEKYDIIICEYTKHKVNRWKWTGRKKPLESKEIIVKCKYCNGRGVVKKNIYYNTKNPIDII